jgi:hypothetical protein
MFLTNVFTVLVHIWFLLQIGMLAGIMDIHLLFCIFGLTATTMLFGLLQEQITAHLWGNPEQKSMLAFWLGMAANPVWSHPFKTDRIRPCHSFDSLFFPDVFAARCLQDSSRMPSTGSS